MKRRRRDLLGALTIAAGSATTKGAVEQELTSDHPGKEMVTGIGGLFFRAHNPKTLAQWYRDHLGIVMTPQSYNDPVWRQQAGITVFSPFPNNTNFFGDFTKQWMINFRVRSLDRMVEQLLAAGIAVKLDPKTYPNGRFARLHDPEGNPIELWEPKNVPG